jgi:hypothetical protein
MARANTETKTLGQAREGEAFSLSRRRRFVDCFSLQPSDPAVLEDSSLSARLSSHRQSDRACTAASVFRSLSRFWCVNCTLGCTSVHRPILKDPGRDARPGWLTVTRHLAAPRRVGPKKLDETPELPGPHVKPVQGAPGLNQLGYRPPMS